MKSNFSVRSMYAQLRRVAVRRPTPIGDYAAAGWRAAPDMSTISAEHEGFVASLRGLGIRVDVLEPTPGQVDSIYSYDAVFVTGRGSLVLNPAKPARTGEAATMQADLSALGVPVIGRLGDGATADGGDLMWLDEETLAMGRGFRTNQQAHDEIRALLADEGVSCLSYDSPVGQGPDYCLHLMSYVSLVSPSVATVFLPQLPAALYQWLRERDYALVEVSEGEYDRQGCNVLATAPGQAVLFDGLPKVTAELREAGVEVHTVAGSQFVLGDGGPTCLTRPLLRRD